MAALYVQICVLVCTHPCHNTLDICGGKSVRSRNSRQKLNPHLMTSVFSPTFVKVFEIIKKMLSLLTFNIGLENKTTHTAT